jgi:hypothetical protein
MGISMENMIIYQGMVIYQDIERYSIVCWECESETFFDYDQIIPMATECWRCGEIINADL